MERVLVGGHIREKVQRAAFRQAVMDKRGWGDRRSTGLSPRVGPRGQAGY